MNVFKNYTSVFTRCSNLRISSACDTVAAEALTAAPLWGPLWQQGEISVLFSETNVGKSILAVQIADEVSRGVCSIADTACEPRNVLYLDYELSDRQFRSRYAGAQFGRGFHRGTPLYGEADMEGSISDIVAAISAGYSVVIVDNITYLSTSIKDSTAALTMMKTLKSAAARAGASILLIAHTPKRSRGVPITKADIAGSSNILNFADSAFAIAPSVIDRHLRYIKQVKAREDEIVYGADSVLVGRFETVDSMLRFSPVAIQREELHL